MAIIFVLLFMGGSFFAFGNLPEFGAPIMKVAKTYIEKGAGAAGTGNLVTAITLNFRRFDSLGMLALIFTSVIGTLVILRSKGRNKAKQ
jgi:multicomponent Na+:H+ antiporter subunit B